jgi:hypothetical protein
MALGNFAGGLASGITQGMQVSNFMKEQAIENQVAEASKRNIEEIVGENGGPTRYKFGDTMYDTKPQAHVLDLERSNIIAGIYEKNGKAREAVALRASANSNFKQAQESAMNKEIQESIANSPFAQIQGKSAQEDAAYQTQLGEYKKGLADGSIAQGTPAPVAPIKQSPTTLDWLMTASTTAALRAKYGQLSPQEMLQFSKGVQELKDEGTAKMLNALHAGDTNAAVQAFNSNGKERVDPSMVTIRKATANVNGVQIPTHEAVIKMPDGSVQVINAAQGLQAVGKINETFNQVLAGRSDGRASAAEGRAATAFAQGQADNKILEAGRAEAAPQSVKNNPVLLAAVSKGLNVDQQVLRDANAALFIKDNPTASPEATAVAQAGNVPGAMGSVKQGITGALVDVNRPTATPLDRAAIVNGIDPNLGKDSKGAAAVALYKERYPNATQAELDAIRTGAINIKDDDVVTNVYPPQIPGGNTITVVRDKHGRSIQIVTKPDGKEVSRTRLDVDLKNPQPNAKPKDQKPGGGNTIGPWNKDRNNPRTTN